MHPTKQIPSKRTLLHEKIRRQSIETFKKTRRQLYRAYNQQQYQIEQQRALYLHVLENRDAVFQQGPRYLQILLEVLNWPQLHTHKSLLEPLLHTLTTYYTTTSLSPQPLLLLIQIMAMIFYQTSITDQHLTTTCLKICYTEFQRSKLGEGQFRFIRNRCLVALWNITGARDQGHIGGLCGGLGVLNDLEGFLDQFPIQDHDKICILGIYTNLIYYSLSQQHHSNSPLDLHQLLLLSLCTSTSNLQILTRTTQCLTSLLQLPYPSLNKPQLIQTMHQLYRNVLTVGAYVEGTQAMLLEVGRVLAEGREQKGDVVRNLEWMFQMLEMLFQKWGEQVCCQGLVGACYWLAVLVIREYQDSPQVLQYKLLYLLRQILNYWTNLSNDPSPKLDYYLLKLLNISLTPSISTTLISQHKSGIISNNAICASTWELITEYLTITNLDIPDPQPILCYLQVVGDGIVWEGLPEHAKERVYQKVQGCYFGQASGDVGSLAGEVLARIGGGVGGVC